METTRTGSREGDIGRLLSLVERRVAARLAAALNSAGCGIDEWRVMTLLADDLGHPMSEIADYALLPAPTLTKLIDRMVSVNRVYRRADDADRRRVLVFLTSRGREQYDALAASIDDEWGRMAAAVGGEEFALLGALLTRIAGRLA